MTNFASLLSAGLLLTGLGSAAPRLEARADASTTQAGTPQTAQQMQQLVAPIALYPDALVAQVLAGATFPEQVVQADRWLQVHPGLQGKALAAEVDGQPWDPSVKALTAFPAVLAHMDKNLSWTSALGDAYYRQQEDVMDAVQVMRRRAKGAGKLASTPQQTVGQEGPTIIIVPADPEVIYVPAYDPWVMYGTPMVAWPGWYPYPGIWFGGPMLSFGLGYRMGFYGGFGWGYSHWGFDWHNRYATYDHGRYFSRSQNFSNRGGGFRGDGGRGRPGGMSGGRGAQGFNGGRPGGEGRANQAGHIGGEGRANQAGHIGGEGRATQVGHVGAEARPSQAAHATAPAMGRGGVRSGAFSGVQHGGAARGFSSRGSSSMGGGHRR